MIKLSEALRLSQARCVAFIGAGGKTSALFQVAAEFPAALLATSTHMGSWQVGQAGRHFIWQGDSPLPDMEAQLGSGVTLITGILDSATQRYQGLNPAQFERLQQLAGYHNLPMFIEADGSRKIGLKAPGEQEPVIPAFVDTVVVVAGLTGLGKEISPENVFRSERFAQLSGQQAGDMITPEILARVLVHPSGGLKNIPSGARRVVLLNQADNSALQSMAGELSEVLLPHFDAVVVSMLEPHPGKILLIKEKIAALILAAGPSSRIGQPKQLLEYHGQTFIRGITQTAIKAGLSPVIVVCGADAEAVSMAIKELPVTLINNPDWADGLSTSIKAGLTAIPANVGGVMVLMADQPQVSVELLRAMLERHTQDLPPVLAPYVFDQRTFPRLYDRVIFSTLCEIQGDNSGDQLLFSKFSPRYLNWYDRRLLLDVNTLQDYQKFLAADENNG